MRDYGLCVYVMRGAPKAQPKSGSGEAGDPAWVQTRRRKKYEMHNFSEVETI